MSDPKQEAIDALVRVRDAMRATRTKPFPVAITPEFIAWVESVAVEGLEKSFGEHHEQLSSLEIAERKRIVRAIAHGR